MTTPSSTQRFNHMAVTVAPDALDQTGRTELLDFYRTVFGWDEMPTMTKDRELLVLRAHSNEQFVFVTASDSPMTCGDAEHLGLSVKTPAELEDIYERAVAYRDRDPRTEIIERKVDDFTVLKLHSFYVRFCLPVMFEVQCYEWAEGAGPDVLGTSE